jgi:hypothetical protein
MLGTNGILDHPVDSQNPEWLDQEVERQDKREVGYKFTLHIGCKSGKCNEIHQEG